MGCIEEVEKKKARRCRAVLQREISVGSLLALKKLEECIEVTKKSPSFWCYGDEESKPAAGENNNHKANCLVHGKISFHYVSYRLVEEMQFIFI